MSTYKIAVLPGDGIGPEVIAQARRVLAEACSLFGFSCELSEGLIGQAALDQTGKMLPPETLKMVREASAVLLGPVGGSRFEHPTSLNHPKQAVLKLRGWLGTYATLRPIRTFGALADLSPLKLEKQGFNLLIVHDHASGLPYGTPRGIETEGGQLVARNTQIYSASEIARVARAAFDSANERQQRVQSVDQSKQLETGQLWRDTVQVVGDEYPEVQVHHLDADNFMFNMVTNPAQFDVVLAEVTVGELLGLAAAGLTGSYAIHPAAYLGDNTGIFQPSHGAALDIAAQGVANPIGAIRAVGMLLDHALHGEQEGAAAAIEAAVEEVLNQGLRPADVCSSGMMRMGTEAIGDAVLAALRQGVGQANVRALQPLSAPLEAPGAEFLAAEPDAQERGRAR